MSSLIRFKRGTALSLASVNPFLEAGEPCFETDTGKFKIGDGVLSWNALPYQNSTGSGGGNGATGATGPIGATGPTGATGATGPAGATGPGYADGDTINGGVFSSVGQVLSSTTKIQFKRGTSAALSAANILLSVGEPCFETDTGKFKIGDGVLSWSALPYRESFGATGPAGATGVAGVTGVTGPVGATGPAGPSGESGPAGVTGPVGATGAAGESGATGATGPIGATGVAGATGIQGATGAGISDGNKGDITVSNSGATLAINAGAVGTADIADSAVTDAKIVAVAATKLTGTIATARLGSGTADSTTFLRGDGAWQAPVASFATSASFPATGITGTYYLDSDRGRLFQWTGSQYAEMGPVSTYPVTHSHSWSDITSGTLPDSRLSANVPVLPGFLLTTSVPTTAIDSGSRFGITSFNMVSGNLHFTFFTPAITLTVSQITMGCHSSAASGLTLARMGLFTYDESTATLVARTANDTTLFAATRTLYTRSFDTAGGFPASYTLQAGVRYAVGVLCVGTTPPQIAAGGTLAEWAALTPRIAAVRTSQSDLSTGLATTAQTTFPLARLS